MLGIYKLESDRLTVAYRKGGPRPDKFESAPGSGITLLVLQREPIGATGQADVTLPDQGKATANAVEGSVKGWDKGPAAAPPPDSASRAVVRNEAEQSKVEVYRVTGISPESALQVLRPVFAGARRASHGGREVRKPRRLGEARSARSDSELSSRKSALPTRSASISSIGLGKTCCNGWPKRPVYR